MAAADRIRRIPLPISVVSLLAVLTIIGRLFGKSWLGALAYAVMIQLIVALVVLAGAAIRRQRRK